ncbi:hypothetical protein L2E82_38233 [Cichorium intybus]|uniref:Uncharacterized protein n=1 Tax=Cichorium intybus TaxID=13427 RepID=A0ACB9AFI3_CICIN|nr:hypothetical protein L2E82_38233 [Cichorium intybus]
MCNLGIRNFVSAVDHIHILLPFVCHPPDDKMFRRVPVKLQITGTSSWTGLKPIAALFYFFKTQQRNSMHLVCSVVPHYSI